MRHEIVLGAISGTCCAAGVIVTAANLLQSSAVASSVFCMVGAGLFMVGCIVGMLGTWRD